MCLYDLLFVHVRLFYYESVAVGEPSELSPAIFPCLASWGEEEISKREKHERKLGGYGFGEVVCKERGLGTGILGFRNQDDNIPLAIMSQEVDHFPPLEQDEYQEYMSINDEGNTICTDIKITDPVKAPCRNAQYGCVEIVDYTKRKEHEDLCVCSPCACHIQKCYFIGSSNQLSEHFGSKHWDSGRRFQYNGPLLVTLNKNAVFIVLQAEKDGILFLLKKGIESIGHTVLITCISRSSSSEQYLYDIVAERGNSCLRLKSYTQFSG